MKRWILRKGDRFAHDSRFCPVWLRDFLCGLYRERLVRGARQQGRRETPSGSGSSVLESLSERMERR